MGDLSPHFSRSEFDCHDGQHAHPTPELVQALERLRAIVTARHGADSPLVIVSGFRDVEYNRRIGGARNSQHIYNRAVDLHAGYCTITEAHEAGFTGIGECRGAVVHVDVRPGSPVVFEDC